MQVRFAIADFPLTLTVYGVAGGWHWRQWGSIYVMRIHAHSEIMETLDTDSDLKDHNFALLGSLNIPVARLPQRLLNYLANEGIVLQAGDTLLNALRALRNKYENSTGFDISSQS